MGVGVGLEAWARPHPPVASTVFLHWKRCSEPSSMQSAITPTQAPRGQVRRDLAPLVPVRAAVSPAQPPASSMMRSSAKYSRKNSVSCLTAWP